jgi:protein-S-isoprenylcysteine O-methyltransferase Ste14
MKVPTAGSHRLPIMTLDTRIPPPLVAVAAALLMWLASLVTEPLTPGSPFTGALALLFTVAGLGCSAAGLWAFSRARTTSNPLKPQEASALVTGGIYRFTRNPMYLGLVLVLVAWAIYLSSLLAVIVVPLFVWYLNRFQIAPEERALSALFREEYSAYGERVRRWL